MDWKTDETINQFCTKNSTGIWHTSALHPPFQRRFHLFLECSEQIDIFETKQTFIRRFLKLKLSSASFYDEKIVEPKIELYKYLSWHKQQGTDFSEFKRCTWELTEKFNAKHPPTLIRYLKKFSAGHNMKNSRFTFLYVNRRWEKQDGKVWNFPLKYAYHVLIYILSLKILCKSLF